tara:strand:- start:95 stop:283 length:189 start_codon:yes stop_codon:yes gene_type:complete
MEANLKIKMDNAAFGEYPNHELARILRELAKRAEMCGFTLVGGHFPAIDLNGNRVGQLRVED